MYLPEHTRLILLPGLATHILTACSWCTGTPTCMHSSHPAPWPGHSFHDCLLTVHGCTLGAVVAADCALCEFALSAAARAVVVSLDLAGSKLSTLNSLVGGGWLWLRELKLAGNRIKGWPRGLAAMPVGCCTLIHPQHNPNTTLHTPPIHP